MGAEVTAPRIAEGGLEGSPWSIPYLRARSLEGRLYSDSLVAALPDVPPTHPLAPEWRLRAESARRLVAYLRDLPKPLRVVDVGCGNGWLTNAIAAIAGSEVVGLDGNAVELRQASRVFRRPNLSFTVEDASAADSPIDRPTVVIAASVIQYVEDLPALLGRLLGWLGPQGELHVLDSPLYRTDEVADAARARTRRHYEQLGVPEMVELYHHHAWSELAGFDVDVLYRPDALRTRIERRVLRRPRSPFPWLRIRRRDDAHREARIQLVAGAPIPPSPRLVPTAEEAKTARDGDPYQPE